MNYYYSVYHDTIKPTIIKDPQVIHSIDHVIKQYGHATAWRLVDYTHNPNGLWYKAMQEGQKKLTYNDIIKEIENDTN